VSLPQFTATTKLAEASTTPLLAVVRAFNALVTNLQQIFAGLLGKVQLDSVLLSGVVLAAGSNTIPHTLGRTLTGWKLTRLSAEALIWDAQATNNNPGTYLVLVASEPCTVSIEVF
jgi:hypothetical protein